MRCGDNGQHIDTEHPTHERKKPMFPITVTITDQAQLNAVLAVLNPPRSTSSPAQPVLDTTPRSDSAPALHRRHLLPQRMWRNRRPILLLLRAQRTL